MRRSLLTTAAIAALLAGPVYAQTQQAPPSRNQAPAPAPSQIQKAPAERVAPPMSGPERGTEERGTPDRSTSGQGEPKAEPKASPKAEQRMKDSKPRPNGPQPDNRTQGQGGQQDKPTAGQTEKKTPSGKMQTDTQTKSEGAGEPAKLTAEQRTNIRTTVIQSSNAPRVDNVTFAVRVGTVVPRTVRVVALPPPLIEIYPQWRSYMYFVRGNDIIVVEPDTLRIVAVLTV